MIQVRLSGQWKEAQRQMRQAPKRAQRAIDAGLNVAGHYMVGQIVSRMRSGLEPPLKPSTLRRRKVGGGRGGRASKPLIKTGDLRNSITVVKGANEVFVGVPRSAGKYKLAAIHENGATSVIRMTDKMRAFLFGVLIPRAQQVPGGTGGGKGIIIVKIPPRPFIGPVFEDSGHQQKALDLFFQTFFRVIGLNK